MSYQIRTAGKISNNMYLLCTLNSNFYIFDTGAGLIAFDTGMNPQLARMQLNNHSLDSRHVGHVFLTHSDYDHAGGLSLFSKADVSLSTGEEVMVTRRRSRRAFIYNRRLKPGYKMMRDRETIAIGGIDIKIIHAPGHTPGSACYLVDKTYLITGDWLLVKRDGALTPFPALISMSHSDNKDSFSKLAAEDIFAAAKYILPGHGGYMSNERR